MKLYRVALVMTVSLAILSGCSTTDEKDGGILDGSQNGVNDASTRGLSDGTSLSGEQFGTNGLGLGAEFSDPANPLSKQVIYFMYDSSNVQQDFIHVIAAHAQYLVKNPSRRVILGGHADERGSREYNIALGEQRAKSVARMMQTQGVAANQLEIVSYGEEKPDADGMDEASWQLNRRVEIAYQGQ